MVRRSGFWEEDLQSLTTLNHPRPGVLPDLYFHWKLGDAKHWKKNGPLICKHSIMKNGDFNSFLKTIGFLCKWFVHDGILIYIYIFPFSWNQRGNNSVVLGLVFVGIFPQNPPQMETSEMPPMAPTLSRARSALEEALVAWIAWEFLMVMIMGIFVFFVGGPMETAYCTYIYIYAYYTNKAGWMQMP